MPLTVSSAPATWRRVALRVHATRSSLRFLTCASQPTKLYRTQRWNIKAGWAGAWSNNLFDRYPPSEVPSRGVGGLTRCGMLRDQFCTVRRSSGASKLLFVEPLPLPPCPVPLLPPGDRVLPGDYLDSVPTEAHGAGECGTSDRAIDAWREPASSLYARVPRSLNINFIGTRDLCLVYRFLFV